MFLEIFRQYTRELRSGERLRLRRPDRRDRLPVPGLPAGRRALPAPVPAHPGRRVPGHQPRAVRADPRADLADRAGASPTSSRRRGTTSSAAGCDRRDPGASLTVVGDSDQSIYAFRGADIRNIVEFERDFPGAKVDPARAELPVDAEHPRAPPTRSSRNNFDRKDKKLWTAVGDGEKIVGFTGVLRARRGAVRRRRDRDAAPARACDYKRHRGVLPHQRADPCAGGDLHPLGRAVPDRRAARSSTSAPRSRMRWPTSSPSRTPTTARAAPHPEHPEARHRRRPPRRSSRATPTDNGITLPSGDARRGVARARAQGDRAPSCSSPACSTRRRCMIDPANPAGARRGRRAHVPARRQRLPRGAARSRDPQDEARAENVDELVAVDAASSRATTRTGTLVDFLTEVSLVAAADELDDSSGTVSLMTLHTAKGLEYDAVFLTGIEEDLLPHRMSADEPGGPAEERRLFYVGITAREEATLPLARHDARAVRRDSRRDAEPVPAGDPGRPDRLAAVARDGEPPRRHPVAGAERAPARRLTGAAAPTAGGCDPRAQDGRRPSGRTA